MEPVVIRKRFQRRKMPQKYVGRVYLRSSVLEIVYDRPADIGEERQALHPGRLGLHEFDAVVVPFQIIKLEMLDVHRPEAQTRCQKDHGIIPFPGRVAPVDDIEHFGDRILLSIPRGSGFASWP